MIDIVFYSFVSGFLLGTLYMGLYLDYQFKRGKNEEEK